jgi:hypothetical protein
MWRDRLAKERASLLIAGVGVELCLAVNYADRRLLACVLAARRVSGRVRKVLGTGESAQAQRRLCPVIKN